MKETNKKKPNGERTPGQEGEYRMDNKSEARDVVEPIKYIVHNHPCFSDGPVLELFLDRDEIDSLDDYGGDFGDSSRITFGSIYERPDDIDELAELFAKAFERMKNDLIKARQARSHMRKG